ncbi:MAG: hypothetical protein NC111_02860 [Bacteroides sp.]|nr:hypothetical protein [Bacteroides sp.]MCM1413231.1 hypothetical protein [Bacteroides sp.]MCM1471459.1 hypothetical protein [Bacteroides sp.]
MIIAVDFDGTIVEHEYPAIGRERHQAVATLKQLQKEGHVLILWTYREGAELEAAVEWCRRRGLEFHCINSNDPFGPDPTGPRKLHADLYIDDRNIGGLPDWGAIYEMIHNGWSYRRYISELHHRQRGDDDHPGLLKRLFRK